MRRAKDEHLENLKRRLERDASSIRAALDRMQLEIESLDNHLAYWERLTIPADADTRTTP